MGISPEALFQAVSDDLRSSDSSECSPLDSVDPDLCSCSDAAVRSVASLNLRRSITKKWRPETANPETRLKALTLFLACNKKCRDWKLADTPEAHALLTEMKWIAYQDLAEVPDWQTLLTGLGVGPGASVGSRGRNSAYEKLFANPMTTTSYALLSEWHKFMAQSPTWLDAELCRMLLLGSKSVKFVDGSKLSTVAKTLVIDRTINTEPSLNMIFQKSISGFLEKVLSRRFRYCQSVQPDRNRRMALEGSRTGRLATIDLTSASDLLPLALFEEIFPPVFFGALRDCRSPKTEIDGHFIDLHMLSAMGNGFTFTVMTYLFSILLEAVVRLKNRSSRKKDSYRVNFSYEQFGVFGDDIICPTAIYEDVVRALTLFGFEPNLEKSYSRGLFRESCGCDAYKGVNVRGVYCKSLRTIQERYSFINRLLRWASNHGFLFPRTISLVLPSKWKRHLVPFDESDDAGLKVPSFLSQRQQKYVAYRPKRRVISFYNRKGNLRAWVINPTGLMLAASIGYADSAGVSRRLRRLRYGKVRLFTPNWDRVPYQTDTVVSFGDWAGICWAHLG